ncbi:MAG: VOC family protein [Desulfosarcinaceae bacterium]
MKATYKHTNLIAGDWRRLAEFYENVFGCRRLPPERDLSGEWLSQGTGVNDAHIRGVHLALPGYGDNGPTLELFQYDRNAPKPSPAANREGFTHIAFEVDDVAGYLAAIKQHGGKDLGRITSKEVPGVGTLTFVYATDPEGNILELLSWK